MDKSDIIRRHIVFFGNVQGVGFRYRAVYAAKTLDLTGWVMNEWDGTVVMEVQGAVEQIDKMIRMINQGIYVWIEKIQMKNIPVIEQEYGFDVRE